MQILVYGIVIGLFENNIIISFEIVFKPLKTEFKP